MLIPGLQAGPYLWQIANKAETQTTWSQPFDIGVVEDAPEIEWTPEFEEITGDNLGATIQDLIQRGSNMTVSMVVQEFGTAAWQIMQPWYNGQANPAIANLGQAIGDGGLTAVGAFARATGVGGAIDIASYRLRATALHPDFSSSKPYQIYFNRATLAPNQPETFRQGTRLKNLPVRFLIFPHNRYADPINPVEDPAAPLVFYQHIENQPA